MNNLITLQMGKVEFAVDIWTTISQIQMCIRSAEPSFQLCPLCAPRCWPWVWVWPYCSSLSCSPSLSTPRPTSCSALAASRPTPPTKAPPLPTPTPWWVGRDGTQPDNHLVWPPLLLLARRSPKPNLVLICFFFFFYLFKNPTRNWYTEKSMDF